tara:strand:- start:238 stop:582 length:345 start_codon:yes stop_codon:yes gene_type:complete
MINVRLTSTFWVSVFRRKLESHGIPIFIIKKGDSQAGSIIIRVSDLQGRSQIFVQEPTADGERAWVELTNGLDTEIEEVLAKQKKFDSDVWIIEVEQSRGNSVVENFLLANLEN